MLKNIKFLVIKFIINAISPVTMRSIIVLNPHLPEKLEVSIDYQIPKPDQNESVDAFKGKK